MRKKFEIVRMKKCKITIPKKKSKKGKKRKSHWGRKNLNTFPQKENNNLDVDRINVKILFTPKQNFQKRNQVVQVMVVEQIERDQFEFCKDLLQTERKNFH